MKRLLSALTAMLFVGQPLQAATDGDAERGKALFKNCVACHKVGDSAKNGVGPNLNFLFGRVAGSVEGARYSGTMVQMGAEGLIWTSETLDAFIENPRDLVERTRMSFRGVKDPRDRTDILAYLQLFSARGQEGTPDEPTTSASAETVDPTILAIQGDLAYGQYLSGECVTCHLADGTNAGIPSITGWPVDDFVVALHAYKNKVRPHPVMQLVTGRLSNEEIAALAAYFRDLE